MPQFRDNNWKSIPRQPLGTSLGGKQGCQKSNTIPGTASAFARPKALLEGTVISEGPSCCGAVSRSGALK